MGWLGCLFGLAFIYVTTSQARECKCAPGDSCWPSGSDWSAFNVTVGGRLLQTELPAAVCYPGSTKYDHAACELVIAAWNDPAFHSNDPVSNYLPPWANNSCNPIYDNGTSTAGDTLAGSHGCTLGKYPPYSVNAATAEHIQAAVIFAKDRNLRLNVKNTGHNPKRVFAFGSLSIWTHNMKSIQYHDNFEPVCTTNTTNTYTLRSEPQKAFTVGPGIQDGEIFHAAANLSLAVVGGSNSDVGLAGWSTGGGHGWLTSEFGMGADNVIQAEIVLPSGEIVVANECQNSDLFWAIRGGGGGTFGVITKLTVKAYPMPQTITWTFSVTKATSDASAWWKLLAQIHAELPALKAGGLQGYYSIVGPPASSALTFGGSFNLYNKPNGTMGSLIKPVLSLLDQASETATYSSSINWAATWIEVFDASGGQDNSAGLGGAASTSRLLPAASLTQNLEFLADVLELIGPEDDPKIGLSNPTIAGCLIASTNPVDNALNPAWRNTTVHMNVAETWKDSTPYTQTWIINDLMTNVRGAALRSLAPGTGVYYNEFANCEKADDFEPEWQQSIWGENYGWLRLKAIKLKYDPNHLQWCRRCVSSESWFEQEDGKLCRAYR
ncbi:FAD-binding domain-containing protein [Xylaria cf. heliscus]|nr:FAD-binding domain-containing protein [Xylaria cf. heliscus]